MSPLCEVEVHDPRRAGRPIGLTERLSWDQAWRPCGYQAADQWPDAAMRPRLVCARHVRELPLLEAAGLAGRLRWTPPNATPPDPDTVAQAAAVPLPPSAVAGGGPRQLSLLEVPL